MSRTARILLAVIVAIIVSVFVYASCTELEAEAATPVQPLPDRAPTTFTAQAAPTGGISVLSTGTCWNWTRSWRVEQTWDSRLAYRFGEDLTWCSNGAGTKVIADRYSNLCYDLGGFYVYEGCNKQRTAFGNSSLRVIDAWHFSFNAYVYTLHETPSVDVRVYPNGQVSGTIYW